ncbi:MAG: hypothetical protein JST90_17355 [Bacteroidetes bacterium]|nr:hypothetical protein [Bacteroidota bacterium]
MDWNLGLTFYSINPIIFEPSQLEDPRARKQIQDEKYHIYVVCKRKKIFFESYTLHSNYSVTQLYFLDEKHDKVFLEFRHPKDLIVHSWKDGIYKITFYGREGELDDLKFQALLRNVDKEFLEGHTNPEFWDLEVVYIGQAFGRTETKTIDYRLSNHEKVQKIALDIVKSGTIEEVIIIGLKIATNDFGTSFVSLDSNFKRPTVESLTELVKKAQQRISEGQEVTVYEASLIKYFKPDLNTEYKETFPSKDFSSYEELMETDFDISTMSIDTEPLGVKLYSKAVSEAKFLHHHFYPLKTKSDKRSLFEFLYDLSNETDESKPL